LKDLRTRLLYAGILALLIAVVALAVSYVLHDPKLSAEATAQALQQELGTPYGFRCVPQENDDGTIELDDVDYVCSADRVSEAGYWVGTDGKEITGRQSMG
jgi:hypothetical protein